MAATPTRNTTVPAANRKPKNRTRKRIIDYPFQPLRQSSRRYPQYEDISGMACRFAQPSNISAETDPWSIPKTSRRVFYTAAAVAKLGLPPRHGSLSVRRPGDRQAFGKEGVNGLRHGPDGLGTPVLRYQVLEVALVRDIAEFDQHRRHVGRLQNPETGGFQRVLVHPHGIFHLARQQPREPVREGAGLALGEVDQNVGDLGG